MGAGCVHAGCVQVEGPQAHPWVRRWGGKYMSDSRGMRGSTIPANSNACRALGRPAARLAPRRTALGHMN